MTLLATILQSPGSIVLSAILGYVTYLLAIVFHNIYLSPLSRIPGPKLWAATRLRYVYAIFRGTIHADVWALHQEYGDIVRIAPNEVSFGNPEAWKTIYTNQPGSPHFPKSDVWHKATPGRPMSILNAIDPKVHSRMRKALDPAFTERAVRTQEPVIQKHVQAFVDRLNDLVAKSGKNGAVVNIVQWFGFVTFDAIGDLGFGEPFGCLQTSEFHPWVSMIFNSLRAATYNATLRFYPSLHWLLMQSVPKSVMEKQKQHFALTADKVDRRLNSEMERPDFLSVIKMDEEGVEGLTYDELLATAGLLIVAGSETTVSVLSGTTNYLVKNKEVLLKLIKEVRDLFNSEDEITLEALREAEYLNAVLHEGLRMCNPTPVGNPRITPPEGAEVCGVWLPGNTFVNAHPLAMSLSEDKFHDAGSFRPERWLKDAPPQFSEDQRGAVQAFSVGPRSCIGKPLAWAELRLILARLVWRFDVESADSAAGRLRWDDQRSFSVVERQPFEVTLRVRPDLAAT